MKRHIAKLRIFSYIIVIIVLILAILLGLLMGTNTGLRIVYHVARTVMPGDLSIGDIKGKLAGPIEIDNLNYENESIGFKAETIIINGDLLALFAHNLSLNELNMDGVNLQLKKTQEKAKEPNKEKSFNKLPLKLNLDNVSINDINIDQGKKHYFIDSIQFNTITRQKTLSIPQFNLVQRRLKLTFNASLQTQRPFNTKLKAKISGRTINGDNIDSTLQLNGNIQKLTLKASVTKPFISTWQGNATNIGREANIQLNGQWKNLIWSIPNLTSIKSKAGQIALAGPLKHYTISLKTAIDGSKIPTGQWTIAGAGNLQQLTLNTIHANTLNGTIDANAQLNWQKQLRWRASLSSKHINPATKWANWPANINLTAETHGHYTPSDWQAHLSMSHISGNWLNKPLSGAINIDASPQLINFHQSTLVLGENSFQIKGQLSKTLNLAWNIHAKNLSHCIPYTRGSILSEGSMTGNKLMPNFKTNTQIKKLMTKAFQLSSLNANLNLKWADKGSALLNIKMAGLFYKHHEITQLIIHSSGDKQVQKTRINLQSSAESLEATLLGAPSNSGWQGSLEKLQLQTTRFGQWQLNHPTQIIAGNNALKIEKVCLKSHKMAFCGHLNWQRKKFLFATLQSSQFNWNLLNPIFPAAVNIDIPALIDVNFSNDKSDTPLGKASIEWAQGKINYQVKDKAGALSLQKSNVTLLANKKSLSLSSNINAAPGQHIKANIQLLGYKPFSALTPTQAITGNADVNLPDLSFLSALILPLQNTAGSINTKLSFNGDLANPLLDGNLYIKNAKLSIEPLNLDLDNIQLTAQAKKSEVRFNGSIDSQKNTLTLKGETNLANHFASTLSIKGKHFLVSNSKTYKIYASPDLNIEYQAPIMSIAGSLSIPEATLTPKTFAGSETLPSNVIYVDQEHNNKALKFALNLGLTLGKVNFNYGDLKTELAGKLHIKAQPRSLTTANGQLNVTKGSYEAYGQRLTINKGQLIYTGGPIANPGLNIRATRQISILGDARLTISQGYLTAGLNITGNLKQPQFTLFSSPVTLSQSDILSYLVLGHGTSSASGAQGQQLLAAASSLGLAKSGITQSIQKTFGLSQLNVESNEIMDSSTGGLQQNTSLVIGKRINPRLTLQYSVGLLLPVNVLRVIYQLSKHFSLQSDTSSIDNGGDVFYTINTD